MKAPKIPEEVLRRLNDGSDEGDAWLHFLMQTADAVQEWIDIERDTIWREGWQAGNAAALAAITKAAMAAADLTPALLRLAAATADGEAEYSSWNMAPPPADTPPPHPLPWGEGVSDTSSAGVVSAEKAKRDAPLSEALAELRQFLPCPTEGDGCADRDAGPRHHASADECASDRVAGTLLVGDEATGCADDRSDLGHAVGALVAAQDNASSALRAVDKLIAQTLQDAGQGTDVDTSAPISGFVVLGEKQQASAPAITRTFTLTMADLAAHDSVQAEVEAWP